MRHPQKPRQLLLPFADAGSTPELPHDVKATCKQLLTQLLVQTIRVPTNERKANERQDSTKAS